MSYLGITPSTTLENLVGDITPQLGADLDLNTHKFTDGTNTILDFTQNTDAENYLVIENASMGNAPQLGAEGSWSDVDLNITAKGAGIVRVQPELHVGADSTIITDTGITTGTLTGSGDVTASVVVNDATNEGLTYPLTISHTTTGIPGIGIASGIQFEAETAANTYTIGGDIFASFTDITPGTEDSQVDFGHMYNGAYEKAFSILDDGNVQVDYDIVPTGDGTTNLGSATNRFNRAICDYGLTNGVTNASIVIAGGDRSNDGGNVFMYGSTHSSYSGWIRFRQDGTSKLIWNTSSWDFSSTNLSNINYYLGQFRTTWGDSSTNNVQYPLLVRRTSTSTPAVGIGSGIKYNVETSNSNYEDGATIEAVTTNVGLGTEAFDLVINLMDGGAVANEKLRISSTGVITATTFAGALSGNASTATTAGTVTTAAQPTITSVGTLTDLTTSGDITITEATPKLILDDSDVNGTVDFIQAGVNAYIRVDPTDVDASSSYTIQLDGVSRQIIWGGGNYIINDAAGAAAVTVDGATGDTTLEKDMVIKGNILTSNDTSWTYYTGGTSVTTGGNMLVYGTSHATQPSRILFKQNNVVRLDIHNTASGDISLRNDAGTQVLILDGPSGQVQFANANDVALLSILPSHATYTKNVIQPQVTRAASTAYQFMTCYSGAGADAEFRFYGDGTSKQDGGTAWGTPADYAEFFETIDGQDIPVGKTVVLDGGKVRPALPSDTTSQILGVIRPKNGDGSIIANSAELRWNKKYLRDDQDNKLLEAYTVVEWEEIIPAETELQKQQVTIEEAKNKSTVKMVDGVATLVNELVTVKVPQFTEHEVLNELGEPVLDENNIPLIHSEPIMEDVEVEIESAKTELRSYESDKVPADVTVPADAITKTHDDEGNLLDRRVLNPDYDPNFEYIPRKDRPEWVVVGLVGQVKVTVGQPSGDRWIKMRDVSATIEEWMVR